VAPLRSQVADNSKVVVDKVAVVEMAVVAEKVVAATVAVAGVVVAEMAVVVVGEVEGTAVGAVVVVEMAVVEMDDDKVVGVAVDRVAVAQTVKVGCSSTLAGGQVVAMSFHDLKVCASRS